MEGSTARFFIIKLFSLKKLLSFCSSDAAESNFQFVLIAHVSDLQSLETARLNLMYGRII